MTVCEVQHAACFKASPIAVGQLTMMMIYLCDDVQIQKRLEQPNPRVGNKVGMPDSEAVLQMAEQLRAELQKCYDLGFHPDAWPVRVTEFMEGDIYKAPAPAPGLTLLFDTSS